MILTSFSVDLVRNSASLPAATRNNPWLMVLAAFINTVPFASLAFACHMFDKEWSFGTPGELRPRGWMMVDVWAAPLIATIYATLIRAHPVFDVPYQTLRVAALRRPMLVWAVGYDTFKTRFPSLPQPWNPLEARAICAIILTVLFACRALYNFGGQLNLEGFRNPTLPSLNKRNARNRQSVQEKSEEKGKKVVVQ
ncbi:hypothetical protein QFC22_000077 [Naganishia vaughanmartiniae]|uniref:Uncharacterized protein n=1 Tax=Naganishia vaughanmartiniae TaxID=1424756 RepID=A0ACC2XMA5_9TREE|nr:hypothetical protein QFC22_000077 [Naganishia vaughanmartiniae]